MIPAIPCEPGQEHSFSQASFAKLQRQKSTKNFLARLKFSLVNYALRDSPPYLAFGEGEKGNQSFQLSSLNFQR